MPFPPTDWGLVAALNSGDQARRSAALSQIVDTYGAPLLALARKDFPCRQPEDYDEMLQEFFLKCWEKNSLGRADPEKGRFRNWLITVFKNAVRNADRDVPWVPTPYANKKAYPQGGRLISTEQLVEKYGSLMEPRVSDTDETLCERVYQYRIRTAALEEFREICEANDTVRRYKVFVARYINPMEDGVLKRAVPSLADLTRDHAFPSEDACKRALHSALAEFRSIATASLARDCSDGGAERECDLLIATFLAN